jgi:hypothetical protein
VTTLADSSVMELIAEGIDSRKADEEYGGQQTAPAGGSAP